MERSEKRQKSWKSVGEMLQREQEEENVGVMVESLGQAAEHQEELEVSNTEDEEEQGCTPLILACHKGMTEVSYILYVKEEKELKIEGCCHR